MECMCFCNMVNGMHACMHVCMTHRVCLGQTICHGSVGHGGGGLGWIGGWGGVLIVSSG